MWHSTKEIDPSHIKGEGGPFRLALSYQNPPLTSAGLVAIENANGDTVAWTDLQTFETASAVYDCFDELIEEYFKAFGRPFDLDNGFDLMVWGWKTWESN